MKILVLGSCVTRDAFELRKEFLQSTTYFARSSLASVFAKNRISGVDIGKISSAFQKRMVLADVEKSFMQVLEQNDFDLFIYDPIDERFTLLADPGKDTLATLSTEMALTGYQQKKGLKKIASGTSRFFALWEKGWMGLLELLRKNNALHKLRINKVFWSLSTENGDNFLPNYNELNIKRANLFLEKIYTRIGMDIPDEQFYVYERSLFLGSDTHRWGKSPFHYIDSFYEKLISKISRDVTSVNQAPEGGVLVSPSGLSLKRYFPEAINNKLEAKFVKSQLQVQTFISETESVYLRGTRVHLSRSFKAVNKIGLAVFVGSRERISANMALYAKSGEKIYSQFFPVNRTIFVSIADEAFSISISIRMVGELSFQLHDCLIGTEDFFQQLNLPAIENGVKRA